MKQILFIYFILAAFIVATLIVATNALAHPPHTKSPTSKTSVSGMGWSASGLFVVYHLSVLAELQNAGVAVPKQTIMAGSSGGSYISAMSCLNITVSTFVEEISKILPGCIATNCIDGHLTELIETLFQAIVPVKGWEKCNGKAYIHMTTAKQLGATQACADQPKGNLTVDHFTSRGDLIDSLLGSSFVMNVSSLTSCTYPFRKYNVMDGYYSYILPCPPGAAGINCLRVSAAPKQLWAEWATSSGQIGLPIGDIYPGMRGLHTLPIPLDKWFFMMFSTDIVKYIPAIMKAGSEDALSWIKANGW
jgi:hypothetical protein